MGGRKQYLDPSNICRGADFSSRFKKKQQLNLSIPMQPKTLVMSEFWIGYGAKYFFLCLTLLIFAPQLFTIHILGLLFQSEANRRAQQLGTKKPR
jgi:hypothetical protein